MLKLINDYKVHCLFVHLKTLRTSLTKVISGMRLKTLRTSPSKLISGLRLKTLRTSPTKLIISYDTSFLKRKQVVMNGDVESMAPYFWVSIY